MRLNIGCGPKHLAGHVNVDKEAAVGPDVVCDIGRDRWPFDDSTIEVVCASHVLEHLTTDELFHCLKEMYRVCRHEATVIVSVPHPRHDLFLNDPTHQRPILPQTMLMFSKAQLADLAAKGQALTPLCDRIGVDFYLASVRYSFDPSVNVDDPELAWKAKHLANIIEQIVMSLMVVKP